MKTAFLLIAMLSLSACGSTALSVKACHDLSVVDGVLGSIGVKTPQVVQDWVTTEKCGFAAAGADLKKLSVSFATGYVKASEAPSVGTVQAK